MHVYIAEYLDALRGQHAQLKNALEGMTDEALDWSPVEGANSLAALTAHIAGAQSYLLGDLMTGRASLRDRDGEFATQQLDSIALAARLDAAMEDSTRSLESLTVDDLATERYSARHQRNFTVAWLLNHALEHCAQHVGHAQITRQLWDQRNSV